MADSCGGAFEVGEPKTGHVVVLQTGDPPEQIHRERGAFWEWIRDASPPHVRDGWRWSCVDVRTHAQIPDDVSACVITGSSASVTERAPWMLSLEESLRGMHARRVPIFGICFGHQILAQALGGHVVRNPRGREMGTLRVNVVAPEDVLFATFTEAVHVHFTHVDTVERLPDGARILAHTDQDRHAAYAIGDHIRCVQFHPEFDEDILLRYIEARSEIITKEGLDPGAIRKTVCATHAGRLILQSFFEIVVRARGMKSEAHARAPAGSAARRAG
jgi:GMP synthase (glutamine-hydrolysing)